jgi:hypothetical protein
VTPEDYSLNPNEFKMYSRVLDPDEIKEAMELDAAVESTGKAATTWARLKIHPLCGGNEERYR